MPSSLRPALLVCLALLLAAALPAAAQTISGMIRVESPPAPLAGALVVLEDAAGRQLWTTLSDAQGRYRLVAPGPGRYRVRVQRIGFRDAFSAPLEAAAGDALTLDLTPAVEPIVLAPIPASSRRRCVVRPADGLALASLWQEARKALIAVVVGQRAGLHSFQVQHYRRHLEPNSLAVLADSASAYLVRTERSPFVSAPAAQLVRQGFATVSDTGSTYWGPDPEVLLSDDFLDAYCLSFADSSAAPPGLVGIGFQPAGRSGTVGIRGILWVERSSFRLRRVEYRYTGLHRLVGPVERLGGEVEFEALPSGAWIVRRWYIRMPLETERLQRWQGRALESQRVISAIIEEGGEVVQVRPGGTDPR